MKSPSPNDQSLLQAARQTAERAYCPYSQFPVGAAVLASDGRIITGCNVENASYGLTICAERNALFAAQAQGILRPARLAVACLKGDVAFPQTLMPCGACRQVMQELLAPDAIILVDGVGVFTLAELLPLAFRL